MKTWPSENVLVVRVIGGLGNQLYELGAGMALAEATGRELWFDRTPDPGATKQHPRPFLLDRLGIENPVWNPSGWRRVAWKILMTPKLPRSIKTLGQKIGQVAVVYEGPTWNELVSQIENSDGAVVLSGYFQTAWAARAGLETIRYGIEGIPLKPEAAEWLETISDEPHPVAVHIRRGDYLSTASAPVMAPDYYERALDRFRKQVPGCRFFVFTDDPQWGAGWAKSNGATLIDCHSEGEPFGDLRLIASCRHFVLSSSTFSAWAFRLARPEGDALVQTPPDFSLRFEVPELLGSVA